MSVKTTPFRAKVKTLLVSLGMSIQGDELTHDDETNFVGYVTHHWNIRPELVRASLGYPSLLPLALRQMIDSVYESGPDALKDPEASEINTTPDEVEEDETPETDKVEEPVVETPVEETSTAETPEGPQAEGAPTDDSSKPADESPESEE